MKKLLWLLLVLPLTVSGQEIALTFDDAPMGDGPFFTGTQRTQ